MPDVANNAVQSTPFFITSLNGRGDGIANSPRGAVSIPFSVPGDAVDARVSVGRAVLQTVISPSPDRVVPFCPWFRRCGGCATQAVALSRQLLWKQDLVAGALHQARINAPVAPSVDAHGAGRRRATFHARRDTDGRMQVGFMAARSHDLVAIDDCPLFAPGLADALPAARVIATTLAASGKPLDIGVTATTAGLDIDIRGAGPLSDPLEKAAIRAAERLGLSRLSNHGRTVVQFRPPQIFVGATTVTLPPGAFLQATETGEQTLAALVLDATRGATRVADLYSGIGSFALRLAARSPVVAVEAQRSALDALVDAASHTPSLHPTRGEARDLARRPLSRVELKAFDAVIFDPPRAGAAEQARELARSDVPLVIGVSCNPETFARDAKMLIDGGYTLGSVTPVDQFRHSAHVEIVGVFTRARPKKKRSLLG